MTGQRYAGEPLLTVAGITPLAFYAADPVRGGLLGLVVLACLPTAAAALYLLRLLVPAAMLLPLVLALSCACCYLATLALKLAWYPAGTALALPLALAGSCSVVVLAIYEMALYPGLKQMLSRALATGSACLAWLLGVGLLRGHGAWAAGYTQPGEWLDVAGATAPAGWITLLTLGLLLGVMRATATWRSA